MIIKGQLFLILSDLGVARIHQIDMQNRSSGFPEHPCKLAVVHYTCTGLDRNGHPFGGKRGNDRTQLFRVVKKILPASRIDHRLLTTVGIDLVDDRRTKPLCSRNERFRRRPPQVKTDDDVRPFQNIDLGGYFVEIGIELSPACRFHRSRGFPVRFIRIVSSDKSNAGMFTAGENKLRIGYSRH